MDYAYVKEGDIESKLRIDVLKIESVETKDRRVMRKLKKPVIVLGGDEGVNRSAVECKYVDVLLHPERNSLNDGLHQRRSGLNQVLCKLAKQNNISIGFSFNLVLQSKGRERARIIGRMRQNVRLCRKYKVNMKIGSFTSNKWGLRSYDCLVAFGKVLGMTAGEAKNSVK
tara:strand:+ start:141 stop:650 length:510 start_codon:yes stop_codon:yes gene_type:complete